MIKSNRNMLDIVDISKISDFQMNGKVRIDLTDPITGKVKERVEGKNLVFRDAILTANGGDWVTPISSMNTNLMDYGDDIDPNMPFALGNTIAYGRPSTGSSGITRGAYNAANQLLAAMTLEKVRWKFQYDFTTAQANTGTIRTVNITNQFRPNTNPSSKNIPLSSFKVPNIRTNLTVTSDGRYKYGITNAGIITVYDEWLYTTTTIDVSAVVGTVSGDQKNVGYSPKDNTYYVYVYSSTASNRKLHKFSDATFTTLVATYSCSNVATFGASNGYPVYIYGNYMYYVNPTIIYQADFVNNTAVVSIPMPTVSDPSITLEGSSSSSCSLQYKCCPSSDRYLLCGDTASGGGLTYTQYIFNLSTGVFVGQRANYYPSVYYSYSMAKYPKATYDLPCQMYNNTFYFEGAVTGYKLPTPITKTSANGMTATYELEVLW